VITVVERHSREASERILDAVLRRGAPLVIVPSPPGAGKTTLVETVVAAAVHFGLRVIVIAPRAEQTYDFMRRLAGGYAGIRIEALLATERELPVDLPAAGVRQCRRVRDLASNGPGVVVCTVDKLATAVPDVPAGFFDVLICDEAWQVTAKDLLLCSGVAPQALLVGDPGQLPPLVRSDTGRLESRAHRVHWPAPKELLRRHPTATVIPLPATRRLPQDSVDLVQPAFYPDLHFVSAATAGSRELRFGASGLGTPIDRVLDKLEAGDTIVGALLPQRRHPGGEVDEELAELAAKIAHRALERRPTWVNERAMSAEDIGCVDPHRDSGTATRRALSNRGISDEMMVSTPEIWQGLQRPLMIARHPILPGRRLTGFDLEPGRWCVMLSRHQIGCVIVGRDGVGDALERHQHDCAARPAEAEDAEWNGWRAHDRLWATLEAQDRLVRL